MKSRVLWVLVSLLVVGAAAAAQAAAPDGQPARNAPAATIPFELVHRNVVIPVRINNSRPLPFILDTASSLSTVDSELARELGLTVEGGLKAGGAGADTFTCARVQDASFAIAGLEGFTRPMPLACPFRRLSPKFGQEFNGVVGSDFFREFVVELDYEARVVRLYAKDSFAYTGVGESVPMRVDSLGGPIIEAQVTPVGGKGIKGKFVLDIGSSASLSLSSPFVRQHHLLDGKLKTIRAAGVMGTGGGLSGRIGRVAELKIGRFKLESPITLFSQDQAGAFASTELQGNIGERLLSRFRVFFDYSHGRVILEPNSTFGAPFDRAYSGLALIAEGSDYRTFRVTDVLEDSPASAAGLQKGDIIAAVGDRPAAQLTLNEVTDMLERPASYDLTIRRGERTLQVTLTPGRLI